MSNEKIVLDLKEGLTVKDTTAIPIFFRNRLEEVITGNPEVIGSIHLENENNTMILVDKQGSALCRVITVSILQEELEFILKRLKTLVSDDITKEDIELVVVYNIAYRNGKEEPTIYYKDKETGEEKPIYGFCYKTITLEVREKFYSFNLFYFIPEYSPENNYSVVRTKGKVIHKNIVCVPNIMDVSEDDLEVIGKIWEHLSPGEIEVIAKNSGVYKTSCPECISVDFIFYVIDSMIDSRNVSKEEFLFYVGSEDKPEGYLN